MEFRRHENRLISILVKSQCLKCCTEELLFSGRLSKSHGCKIICLLIVWVGSPKQAEWHFISISVVMFSLIFFFSYELLVWASLTVKEHWVTVVVLYCGQEVRSHVSTTVPCLGHWMHNNRGNDWRKTAVYCNKYNLSATFHLSSNYWMNC
jgi:hypothetical protein